MTKEFEPKYKLIEPSAQILNEPVAKFDFANPPVDPFELSQELVDHMNHYKGLGLSANQLGLPYRVFAMVGEPYHVCFNPTITAHDDNDVLLDEGCLSWPGLYLKIFRPSKIRVRFQDYNGDFVVKKFSGLSARVLQHEYEHLEGERFVDLVSKFKIQRAQEKQTKLLKKVRRGMANAVKQEKIAQAKIRKATK